ncbi:iron-sulfur cluster-binding protein [bacterium]|nr:iron-sulfur cluster-binding protein [bacterium]
MLKPRKTHHYIRQALKNDCLRAAVGKATDLAVRKRQDLVNETPYWEDLRHHVHHLKSKVLENPEQSLMTFEARCIANGINVHWAEDAAEARQIIVDLAAQKKVKKIVKSKSLTTEEIELNPALEKAGLETWETDLGEYIVQLEGKTPSHLTMPALHLSRYDIGRLFEKKLGIEYTDNPNELLQVARQRLREHFLSADMGISGVNFAAVEEGAFVVIENEANAHLSISIPKIHVAIMGLEKLIPSLSDLPYFLKVLAPSATGQKASSYVNIIGGPQQHLMEEGPEEVHLVILDNGRSNILADASLRETLFCIRCGACLNICPVFRQVGGHAYGWAYMGPIGATLIPLYNGLSEGRYAPFLSSLCGACFDNCPMRIQIPKHLLTLRNRIAESGKTMLIERVGMKIWSMLAVRPRLYRFITGLAAIVQQLIPFDKAFPAPGYVRHRALGRMDSKGFRSRFMDSEDRREGGR